MNRSKLCWGSILSGASFTIFFSGALNGAVLNTLEGAATGTAEGYSGTFFWKTKNLDLFDVDYLKGVLFNQDQGLIMRKMQDCKIENELNIIDCCYLQLMNNN